MIMTRDAFRFFTGLAGAILAVMGALMLLPTPEEITAAPADVTAVPEAEDDSRVSNTEPPEDEDAPTAASSLAASSLGPGVIGSFDASEGKTLAGEEQDMIPADQGFGWSATTDERMGGTSTAALRIENGALVMEGEIGDGFAYPWAGAIYFPGDQPMAPTELSATSELVFRARGEGTFRLMLFAPSIGRIPAQRGFDVSTDWAEVRIDLREIGGDLEDITALSIAAGGVPGPYRLEIDDVELQ